jgi:predicted site-specific integrase-resolvase
MGNPDLIGSAEACSILGDIDRGTLVRWIAAGKIAYVTKLPGGTGAYVFDRAEVERVKREQDGVMAS